MSRNLKLCLATLATVSAASVTACGGGSDGAVPPLEGGGSALGSQPGHLVAAASPTIIVTTAPELAAALSPANAGARILVRAGVYDMSQALTVPDEATLAGEGVMSFDESGLPTGFEASGRTVLRATVALEGDVLTLGDRSTVKDLVIEDVVGRPVAGNPVAVVSRAAGDFISATITRCELINPNPSAATQERPTGRGVAVVTRNPNLGDDPPPHEGALLQLKMTQSIVRSPRGGDGVFAINFASLSQISLDLKSNVIGGALGVSGGVGRPDAVTGASVLIHSSRNLYRSDSPGPTTTGWQLLGGADSPPSPLFVSEASTFNWLQIHSKHDRIEGVAIGIAAVGGRRIGPLAAPISSNRVEMNLLGTRLATTTADLRLSGARSLVPGVFPDEGNTLHVVVHQASGSGPRSNMYVDAATAPPGGSLGAGNRLEIVGNANAFDRTNEGFVPPPPAEFFTGGHVPRDRHDDGSEVRGNASGPESRKVGHR
ncbi:MAG TPA: hypothetical protein VLT82_16065 [Myxococcaceae bacterium]|nr:hypothetical protein [Myxococcaceae bacterium]